MAIWSTSTDEQGFYKRLHQICFKTNLDYDNLLLPYDIRTLQAHCSMLKKANLLSSEQSQQIIRALQEMLEEVRLQKLAMSQEDEDCHSLIESRLIEKVGSAGKKLYMARSRNDQVVCATRLYTKDRLLKVQGYLKSFCQSLLSLARENEFVPMVGYTHTQKAMPSSVGMWLSSYVEILLNQKEVLEASFALNDVNVLGSAAGYGTGFDIDREVVTKELGLAKTQINSLSCQLSRGQVECQTLQSCWGVMFVLNRLANDLVWLTSGEFDFVKVSSSCTTGSSLMPNKKNLDPCEIVRSRYHIFNGYLTQLQGVVSNLFYGYNSDYQESKGAFIEGLSLVETSLEAMGIVVENISFKEENLFKAFDKEVFATDYVNRLVMQGEAFRDAYIKVKRTLKDVPKEDPLENIKSKTHLGSTGNLGLEVLEKRLESF